MNIIKNLFSLTYYSEVLAGTKRFRWLLAIFIIAVFISIQSSIFMFTKVYPVVKALEKKAIASIQEIYPDELQITIKNGIASTNVTEPYYISVRQETLENLFSLKEDDSTKSKIRLLAIDTKGKADDFEQYQSLALLTQTSVVYYDNKEIKIYPLRDIQDLTINKQIILSKIKEINNKFHVSSILNILVLLSPLLILLGAFLGQLIAFLFFAIPVYIMVRINQLPNGYSDSFRYGVLVSFIPTIIWNALEFIPTIGTNFLIARSLLTIITLVIAYLGIKRLRKPTTSHE